MSFLESVEAFVKNIAGSIINPSTEEGQASLLTELELKADLTDTQPVSASSLPLPAGAATSANQTGGGQKTQVVDGSNNTIGSTVNADRTTNIDGVRGWNVIAAIFGRVSDTIVKSLRLDAVTEALISMSYAHHETHAGTHFFYKDAYPITKNGVVEHLIITPNTTLWAHMILGIDASGGQVNVSIFEGSTVSANGLLESVVNRNRNSVNTNTTLIYHSPTVLTDGTQLSLETLGIDDKKSAGGGTRDSDEIVLKQNTIYLVRTAEQNVNNTVININFDWYEHTSRN